MWKCGNGREIAESERERTRPESVFLGQGIPSLISKLSGLPSYLASLAVLQSLCMNASPQCVLRWASLEQWFSGLGSGTSSSRSVGLGPECNAFSCPLQT